MVTNLQAGTQYFYRARATNSAGVSWAATSTNFVTASALPIIDNIAADDIGSTRATLGAIVTENGGDLPQVTIFYGTVDGGTNTWQHAIPLGAVSDEVTTTVTNLLPSDLYYYRAFATNSAGSAWADASASFVTATPAPPSVRNKSATGITGTTANLRGEVTETGFDIPIVRIHYGTSDGLSDSNAWDAVIELGPRDDDFTTFVTGLSPETLYYYRAEAQNVAGTTWADSSSSFTTTPLVPASVIINEINYNPPGVEQIEFVELHNPSDADIDLDGWTLSDAVSFTFPGSSTLPAGGYAVVAADPLAFSNQFARTAYGPFVGKLSNEGENIELRNALDEVIDEVDYGVGFPWPTAADGAGSSIELINPTLDNNLGGSWRSSPDNSPGVTTFIPAASTEWRWRRGTSEASTPSNAWREVAFSEDGSWTNAPNGTPIGYSDNDDNTVITGMSGVHWSMYLRHTFTVDALNEPNTLLLRVYVDDGCVVWINGTEIERFSYNDGAANFNTPALNHEAGWFEYTINNAAAILNGGDNVLAILAANSSLGSSDFSIDAELRTTSPATTASTASPNAANGAFTNNAPPQVRQVDHKPNQPETNEEVIISARITDPDGVASATLWYQIVEPGAYIRQTDAAYESPANWISIPMNDDGTDGDAAAGDSTFSAAIPPAVQQHRRLIRYRIYTEDQNGSGVLLPYADDEQPNFAYFVYDGIPDWTAANQPGVSALNTFTRADQDGPAAYHLIANSTDVNNSQYVGASDGVHMSGTMVYEGKVYDHIAFENRGEASTYQSGKNKWRFHFNRARDFEARDNWGKKYDSPFDELNLDACASPWAPVHRGMAGLDEAISYRMYELAGTYSPRTHYVHFRVVDDSAEAPTDQYAGDLWGLYLSIEHPDGSFLDDRGLPDGNVYKIEGSAGDKKHQADFQSLDASDWNTFRANSGGGQTDETFWRTNMDLFSYFTFRAGNRINGNVDVRYGANHLFYNHPTNGWTVMPWDLDMMFIAETHWSGTIQQEACLNVPAIALEYRNRAREMLDLFCTDDAATGGQLAQLVDEYAQIVNPTGQTNTWADIDQFMWNFHPRTRGNPATHSGQGNHKGNFFYTPFTDARRGGNYVRTLISADHEGFVDYLVDYVTDQGGSWTLGNGIHDGYGYGFVASDAADADIPNTPVVSYDGGTNFPSDDLRFSTSAFSDPQGAGTFAAMKWRLGKISNPSTPDYDPSQPYIYEIESHWGSGVVSNFSANIEIPATAVRVGETLRFRVQHQDDTGRWSHWSDPIEFVVGEPDLTSFENDLMITEVMYHPDDTTALERAAGFSEADFEFIELQNIGTNILILTDLRFTKGVDFDFANGVITNLSPNAYVLVVRNIAAFESRYGTGLPIAGAYGPDSLSNSGENIKLSFGLGSAIHEFDYDDRSPWPEAADGYGPSMNLIAPSSRPIHALATNWHAGRMGGSPGTADSSAGFSGVATDDLDNDGLSAIAEFALHTSDSNSNDVSTAFALDLQTSDGDTFPAFSYRRATDAQDVGIVVEKSSDLVNWVVDPDLVRERETAPSSGSSIVTWRSAAPLDRRCYFRLRVIQF